MVSLLSLPEMFAARHNVVQIACGCTAHTVLALPVAPQMITLFGLLIQVAVVDFPIYELLFKLVILEPKCLDDVPKLKAFIARFEVCDVVDAGTIVEGCSNKLLGWDS